MGMIETRLGDGTYVCNRSDFLARPLLWAISGSSETEANELIEARKLIEGEVVGLAAERATGEELKESRNNNLNNCGAAFKLRADSSALFVRAAQQQKAG